MNIPYESTNQKISNNSKRSKDLSTDQKIDSQMKRTSNNLNDRSTDKKLDQQNERQINISKENLMKFDDLW